MLISTPILPVCLLLIHGVTSADFSNNKRVPRQNTRVARTYGANHPPIIETNEEIPVAVIYDDEKVIKVRSQNETNADVEDGKKHQEYETSFSEKPKSDSNATEAKEQSNNESETRTGRSRKRNQNVRKVKVDERQRKTTHKEAQKEAITTTDKNRSDGPFVPTPQTFKPRTGMRDPVVPIIESESYVFSHSGKFHYSYEGGDGTKAYERGVQKISNGSSGSAVEGNYSYKDKDGNEISLTYTADENGYRPVGDHLPTPPPIPPAIQRALAYLATKTTPEPVTEKLKTL